MRVLSWGFYQPKYTNRADARAGSSAQLTLILGGLVAVARPTTKVRASHHRERPGL